MIPMSLLSSVWPESSEGCAGLSVNSMDSYEARQDATEEMLLEELEAKSQNIDICDSDMSDIASEHQVNILIKKNVTMCLHMKLILMEIT